MSQCDELAEAEQPETAGVNGADENIVQIEKLTKRYGDFTALDDCRLAVRRGEVFGLLGPNGAGKTTLIRLMLGFLQPTSGRCLVDGFDPHVDGVGLRERVAYLPGDARLPRHMRGGGVLKFFAEMHPAGDLERSLEVADRLELQTRRRVGFMSTGMRQKLALSVVLGLATPLLILDEPTANLDPTIRAAVLDLVLSARDQGRTVIFSSHVLSEIEDTCDRVAFLRHGKLAHELTMNDLFQRHRITARQPAELVHVPEQFKDSVTLDTVQQGRSGHLQIDTAGDLAPLLAWVDSLNLQQIRIEPLGLRAVYDSVHSGSTPVPGSRVSSQSNSGDQSVRTGK
jgi:ABC-2 type transport system ATP-binding protein